MILGITGTPGAGKGSVVTFLQSQKNFFHISAREIWTQELIARELPVDRDHMTILANELRAEHGADYFVRRALEIATAHDGSVVIESIRAIGEAELLKKTGGVLLAVDALQDTRYARINVRGSILDNVSFEDFKRQEAVEMENEDPAKQNIRAVMAMADYTIMNNGTLQELQSAIEAFLNTYQNR